MMSRRFGAYSAMVFDHRVAERFALLVPGALGQVVGRVLHEARHHVLARRRDAGIGQRRDDDVDVGLSREAAVLRLVVGPLHVVDARRDRDGAAQVRSGARQAGEVRQRVEREVHLARRAAELVAPHVVDELVWQRARGSTRRRNVSRGSTLEATTPAAISSPFFEHDARAPCSLATRMRATAASVRISTPASRAASAMAFEIAPVPPRAEPPRSERAVDLAHVVMQQHVRRAGRAHAEERPDDARRRHRGLEHVGLEPLVEEIDRAHRHQLDLVVLVVAREPLETPQRGRAAA